MIRIDPQTGRMDGAIVIDAASGDSGLSIRDERMRSSVLEAGRYPEITFAPQQIVSHGDPHGTFPVKIRGQMMLHGAAHELTVDATVTRAADDATIRCTFGVPFVAWGLEDPSILMFKVAKVVNVDVTATVRVSWAAAEPIALPAR